MPDRNTRTMRAVVGACAFACVALLILVHLRVFSPRDWVAVPPPYQGYAAGPMQTAMAPARVEAALNGILSFGPRFMGQPGLYKTEDHLRKAYKAAGLELYEHEVLSVAPTTAYSEIYLVDAADFPSNPPVAATDLGLPQRAVDVHPFMPNHLQPVATPITGLVGRLVLLNEESLRTRERFDGCIGLIDSLDGAYDYDYGFVWPRYARLGLSALIVSHSRGLDNAPWHLIAGQWKGMVASVPVNFVRVAASREVFAHTNRLVRLRVKSVFANIPGRTLFGVLRAKAPSRTALIVAAGYDACSILPDSAPGVLRAISPAMQVQLLKGLLPYRDTIQRDVIFCSFGAGMMAEAGLNRLIGIIQKNTEAPRVNPFLAALGIAHGEKGRAMPSDRRRKPLLAQQAENDGALRLVREIAARFDDQAFLIDPGATRTGIAALGAPARALFKEQFTHVLNTIALELAEPMVAAKTAYERDPAKSTGTPEFRQYLAARRAYEDAAAAAGYSAVNLLDAKRVFAATHRVRERCAARVAALAAHHEALERRCAQELAIVALIDRYDNVAVFEPKPVPAFTPGGAVESVGIDVDTQLHVPALPSMINVFTAARQRLRAGRAFVLEPLDNENLSRIGSNTAPSPVRKSPRMWSQYGYPSYTLVSLGRGESYKRYTDPVDLPFMRDLRSLSNTLAFAGEVVLSLAHGNGRFEPVKYKEWLDGDFKGRVLLSGVGQSIVPNYPLGGAAVANHPFEYQPLYSWPGCYEHLIVMTDLYGEYDIPHDAADFPVWWRVHSKGSVYSPIAAGYGPDGSIIYVKDEGEDGQRVFKSVNVGAPSRHRVTIVTFRAAPVTVCDMTNPQAMRDYSSVTLLGRSGLTQFRQRIAFPANGFYTAYIPPDERFFAALNGGAPDNPLMQMPRAFMLGNTEAGMPGRRREIDGEGYLAADSAFLYRVPFDAGNSMADVNGRRLALQNRYDMADEWVNDYQRKCLTNLAAAAAPQPLRAAVLKARDAVTYATLNHPVLRGTITEAVIGIVWYLGLLVPFVFFFEKLLFCFPDVRKQLTAQLVIFLVVFSLLRLLHPAFQMVRSSLMILLGFIIVLISGGITVLFSGKFKENLEELRKKQGKVTAAEVNTLGVVGSAFMLGLNNMNRRKVRTGLTCATLTLLTFVMICLTSVRNDLVEESTAIGKAPYEGMLIKNEQYLPVSDAEVFAYQSKYADRFDVCARRMYVGTENWADRKRNNPELKAAFRQRNVTRHYPFDSILQFSHREPLRHQLRMVTTSGWFTAEQDRESTAVCPVLIPDAMAAALSITPESVDRGGVQMTINGRAFLVRGIFTAGSLDALRGLDDVDLLPFDIEAMQEVDLLNNTIVAKDDDPRIPAAKLVITPVRTVLDSVPYGSLRTISIAVAMPDAPYKEVRNEIQALMEQTARPLFYGLDGIAYKGRRMRGMTLAGMLDLVIPLVIAGLTVLNTMKGSVYERRGEIYVYNAVGIAPRYVFFMFFAEAFVYAVVGSILGYLLSQGTGRILTALDLTGGMRMTFTSLSTIYASLTIVAAVFISTYFPAKSAMEIAAPAEDAGWSLPEPDGDDLSFDLPFNFSKRERVAVLAFFDRYLHEHGEGSAGRFYASVPQMHVAVEPAADAPAGPVPQIAARIWLKPFDLAVSQQMTIAIPPDQETRQYKATICLRRLTGTREAWLRLNRSFVAIIRRHFLHWRAVGEDDIAQMFEEAKLKLETA
ncbi:ABC transporter permease [bacterium]|nr:ABC transporter permease [bacterium]